MLHFKKYLGPFLGIYETIYITKYMMLGILHFFLFKQGVSKKLA